LFKNSDHYIILLILASKVFEIRICICLTYTCSYEMTPPFKILIFLEILIRFSQTVKTIFQRCDDNNDKKKVLSKNQSEEQKKIKEKWTLGTFTNKKTQRNV